MPGISSLKRRLERALSRLSTSTSTEEKTTDDSSNLIDRASPKSSTYELSPAHSGDTLQDAENAPSRLMCNGHVNTSRSGSAVSVLTIGDNHITVEAHQINGGSDEQIAARQGNLAIGRRNTAPSILHGPVRTLDSSSANMPQRSLSTQRTKWKRFGLTNRTHFSPVPKGKARSITSSSKSGSLDNLSFSTPLHSSRDPATSLSPGGKTSSGSADISPHHSVKSLRKKSVVSNSMESEVSVPPPSNRSSDEMIERKDSHFPDAVLAKEKTTAALQADLNEELNAEKTNHKRSSLLPLIKDWVKQHRRLTSSTSSSNSSSSSPSPLNSGSLGKSSFRRSSSGAAQSTRMKITRWPSNHDLARHEREPSLVHLPPGFDVPEIGDAGPSDWVSRVWDEHFAQASKAQDNPPTRTPPSGEEVLRTSSSTRELELEFKQPCYSNPGHDNMKDSKGKGPQLNRPVLERNRSTDDSVRHRNLERMRSNGTCVTTLTLSECRFDSEQMRGGQPAMGT